MADENVRLAGSPPARPTRSLLTKQTLATREGRNNTPARPDMHSASSPFSSFGDGSGSSSSKPYFSFRDVTSPSSFSKTQSPDTELETPPKLVQSPRPAYFQLVKPDPGSSTPASLLSGDISEPPQVSASSPSGTSESEDYGGPTRASIRAWAKATPAGAPTGPSTRNSPELSQSGSDDNVKRTSLTRASCDFPASAESSVKHSSLQNSSDREESSGNVADGESSGSEQSSPSPHSGSPPPDEVKLAAQRELSAPHPHPQQVSPPSQSKPIVHPHSADTHQRSPSNALAHARPCPHAHPRASLHARSSPDSSLLAPIVISAPAPTHPDQQERAERRHRQHRRRHRDRERERDRDRRTRHPNPATYAVVSVPALPPLRPLRPPPPPLPLRTLHTIPLRTIPLPHSPSSNVSARASADIFGEIEKMLRTTRKPLLRVHHEMDENETDAGWLPFPAGAYRAGGSPGVRRENDVLEDIRTMVQWSRR